jgi:DNA polymerase
MKATITNYQLNDKNQWVGVTTHPGKLTENADQAVARDLLANGIKHGWNEGLDIRLHVHDQIVALEDEDRSEKSLKLLIDCMCRPAKWNRDLPLAAAGSISKVFIKD